MVIIGAILIAGCATSAPPPGPDTYKIPVIASDNTVQQFTVEREPGDTETMLFCIESPTMVLCIAEDHGRALRYFMPIPQRDSPPERPT